MHRTTRNKDEGRGTPQGAPISPLLANLYMRRFVLGWKTLGHEQRFQARIVNYADDFVICCRGTAEEALAAMRNMMERLKLTVNETKTHVCRLPAESFDFLGYTFGRCYSPRTGRAYLGTASVAEEDSPTVRIASASRPADVTMLLDPKETGGPAQPPIARLGQLLLPGTGAAEPIVLVDRYVTTPAPPVVVSEAQGVGTRDTTTYSRRVPVPRTGTGPAAQAAPQPSVGESMTNDLAILVREPDAGNPPVRFDEREVETEHGCGY